MEPTEGCLSSQRTTLFLALVRVLDVQAIVPAGTAWVLLASGTLAPAQCPAPQNFLE